MGPGAEFMGEVRDLHAELRAKEKEGEGVAPRDRDNADARSEGARRHDLVGMSGYMRRARKKERER